jgi:hypothetical protein
VKRRVSTSQDTASSLREINKGDTRTHGVCDNVNTRICDWLAPAFFAFSMLPAVATSARAQVISPSKELPEVLMATPQTTPQFASAPLITAPPLAATPPLAASPPVAVAPQVPAGMVQPSTQCFGTPQASSQSGNTSPCACYYPQGYCPFPQGNCAFPRGNCVAPMGSCVSPAPQTELPQGSPQVSPQDLMPYPVSARTGLERPPGSRTRR